MKIHPEKSREDPKGSGTATLELFVSIYLLLLGFFVVLNSISNQKVAKAGAVMESVNSVFDKKFAPRASVVDFLKEPDAIAPNDEFVDEAIGLLASVFAMEGGYSTEGGDTLRVELPLDSLFERGSMMPRQNLSPFVRDMQAMIERQRPGQRREVEFIFGSGQRALSSRNSQQQLVAMRRAGNLVNFLISNGFADASISTGISAGSKDIVVVNFREREEAEAAVTFEQLVEGRR
jgi:hypothetical protein